VKSSLHVLAILTDAFGARGGIAQYNRDFMTALSETDRVVAITLLTRNAPDHVVNVPAKVRQLRPYSGRIAYSLAALLTALSARVDIVFCGHLYMVPLAYVIAKLKKAKLIIQTLGIEAWPRPSVLRRAAVESADIVLAISRYTRARVLEWAAIAPERVMVLPVTVCDHFSPGDGSALRKAWGLGNKKVLLTVGRMACEERYKGHDRVIAAIPDLVKAAHDLIYVIAGEGSDRPRLEDLARSTGVADRVRFPGALSAETLLSAYRMADLFVMPSTGEGFGIAFLEAMACGTPALGLAVAGASDALADGALGMAVSEIELPRSIAKALNAPAPDRKLLADSVRARFGANIFAARTKLLFQGI
jgi:phosphatidylinositol alpha-1,6-mannosyltransferase